MKKLFNNAFYGKTVLVTGHTGFKGSWLSIWLTEMGAKVVGYALPPYTGRDNFVLAEVERRITSNIGDIRDFAALKRVFDRFRPEIVFHLAAQPLVRLSYQEPRLTYETNVGGSVNLLECCRLTQSVKVIVNVTSDKCYENKEHASGYCETDALGGYDPYSSSKACSEIVTAAYQRSFFDSSRWLSSARAGNVIGGGDWRPDRLVPDCIRALERKETIGVRAPNSVRPWQHVLEPLGGYLLLAARMLGDGKKYSGAWNFGPELTGAVTVKELVQKIIDCWGNGRYEDLSETLSGQPHEAGLLMLDVSKAAQRLKWRPVLSLDEAVEFTVEWYKTPSLSYDFCVRQVSDYLNLAAKKRIAYFTE